MKRADALAVGAALLMVLGTIAGSAAARDRPAQMKRLAAADGVLALSNSLDDGAIITAHGLLPGQSSSGTITLGNTGEVAGMLTLARTWINDVPGPNGGRLSNVITLSIEDVTGAQPRQVAFGEAGALEHVALGPLPAGAQRTYRFTVGFPDSGPHGADNAYVRSALRMDYKWRADAVPAAAPPEPAPSPQPAIAPAPPTGPQPAPPAGPQPAPAPPAGPLPASPPSTRPPRAPMITIRVPHQRVVHTDAVRLFARCDESCRVRFSGRVVTAPRGKRARRSVLLRKSLFRGERRKRRLSVTTERAIKLKLTRKGRRVVRRALDRQGRVAVVITARVRGANGTRKVRKRIVLHTTLIRNGKRITYR